MTANIMKLKKIVKEHQAMEIDGTLIDAFSASAALTVYNALSEKNQERFASEPITEMVRKAFILLKRVKK